MGSDFRPHDHDPRTESMEGRLLGFGPVWEGVGLQRERGVSGYAVNRWGIKRPPNGTKFEGRSIGDIPRPVGKYRHITRTFFGGSQNKI